MNEPSTVPCQWCGTPTTFTATRECISCNSVRHQAQRDADLVMRIARSVQVEAAMTGRRREEARQPEASLTAYEIAERMAQFAAGESSALHEAVVTLRQHGVSAQLALASAIRDAERRRAACTSERVAMLCLALQRRMSGAAAIIRDDFARLDFDEVAAVLS